jgi:hypothetical protein
MLFLHLAPGDDVLLPIKVILVSFLIKLVVSLCLGSPRLNQL